MNVYSLTNFLKEYCNTKVPKEFSHYTSTEALINIFKSNSLRFTDCEFLNDSEEYVYVDNLLFNDERYFQEEKVRKFLDDCEDSVYFDANLISEFDGYYKKKEMNIKKHKYYVLCGTNNDDLLSMWNYYCKNTNIGGYSIKIDTLKLIEQLSNEEGELFISNIIYDQETQIKILTRFIEKAMAKIQYANSDDEKFDIYDDFSRDIEILRLFFKNPGFSSENETRIVIKLQENSKVVNFSSINGIIKPYIEYEFSKFIPLTQITIAPMIEEDVARKGLLQLLDRYVYGIEERCLDWQVKIKSSKIKLRY